jgi:hypothetical protein
MADVLNAGETFHRISAHDPDAKALGDIFNRVMGMPTQELEVEVKHAPRRDERRRANRGGRGPARESQGGWRSRPLSAIGSRPPGRDSRAAAARFKQFFPMPARFAVNSTPSTLEFFVRARGSRSGCSWPRTASGSRKPAPLRVTCHLTGDYPRGGPGNGLIIRWKWWACGHEQSDHARHRAGQAPRASQGTGHGDDSRAPHRARR